MTAVWGQGTVWLQCGVMELYHCSVVWGHGLYHGSMKCGVMALYEHSVGSSHCMTAVWGHGIISAVWGHGTVRLQCGVMALYQCSVGSRPVSLQCEVWGQGLYQCSVKCGVRACISAV